MWHENFQSHTILGAHVYLHLDFLIIRTAIEAVVMATKAAHSYIHNTHRQPLYSSISIQNNIEFKQ